MRPKNPNLNLQDLKNKINYDPNSGVLTWKISYGGVKVGDKIGTLHHSGYLICKLGGRQLLTHRLIWFYMTGEWPDFQIDHIDTNKTNNKWSNLRLAIHNENQRNKNLQVNNTSGYKGVYWYKIKQKWRAHIKVNGKTLTLGNFDNIIDAVKARDDAGKLYHKDFNRT